MPTKGCPRADGPNCTTVELIVEAAIYAIT